MNYFLNDVGALFELVGVQGICDLQSLVRNHIVENLHLREESLICLSLLCCSILDMKHILI